MTEYAQPAPVAHLTFDEYGAGIGSAATVLRANATSTGLDAPVPTCPRWTVTDLVAHQGMVHRWAADNLRRKPSSNPSVYGQEGRGSADLLEWFDEGATALLDVLSKAPEDWPGSFFLKNADNARDGWARRQCHETTIHAVDAMAARLGRVPRADEVWFSRELAVDGVDELLLGFVPRSRSRLRSEQPLTIELATTDTGPTGHAWTVVVSAEQPEVRPGLAEEPDVRWSGPARDLYLAVWNRAGGPVGAGADGGEGAPGIQVEFHSAAGANAGRLWAKELRVRW